MYSIKDMSEKFNLPASAIRYYEEIGLLENVEHKNGYHRIYDESHVDRLNAIECFKKARLPLKEIKLFFEYEKDMKNNSQKIVEMMDAQKKETEKEIKNLKAGLAHLEKKIKYYSIVDEAVKSGKKIPSWQEVIGK
ncbi:MAG: MerR family transcriptional regulator [Spirochaetia bacterium]|nr:MerR family transcriptional regulator [Spirochaetia bacterium]